MTTETQSRIVSLSVCALMAFISLTMADINMVWAVVPSLAGVISCFAIFVWVQCDSLYKEPACPMDVIRAYAAGDSKEQLIALLRSTHKDMTLSQATQYIERLDSYFKLLSPIAR